MSTKIVLVLRHRSRPRRGWADVWRLTTQRLEGSRFGSLQNDLQGLLSASHAAERRVKQATPANYPA
jgi:hypothetical protein